MVEVSAKQTLGDGIAGFRPHQQRGTTSAAGPSCRSAGPVETSSTPSAARSRSQAIADLLAGHVVDLEGEHARRVSLATGAAAAVSNTSARRIFGMPGRSRVPAPVPVPASQPPPAPDAGSTRCRRIAAPVGVTRSPGDAVVAPGEASRMRAVAGAGTGSRPWRRAHAAAAQRQRGRSSAAPRAPRRCSRRRRRPAANPSRRSRGNAPASTGTPWMRGFGLRQDRQDRDGVVAQCRVGRGRSRARSGPTMCR